MSSNGKINFVALTTSGLTGTSLDIIRCYLLALQDDFRTIDWIGEYPFPNISLSETESLLAP